VTRTEVSVVRKQVVVNVPAEQAFTVFTERFGDFKPPEHNLLAAAIVVAALAVAAEVAAQQALLRAIRQDLRAGGGAA